jgi:2-oxo-hept-3-ene-1,7-dioate hydratase/2-keto-4-pentenoate hydratase
MKLTAAQHNTAAASLYEAEKTGVVIDPISSTFPEADTEDAYTIAQTVVKLKVADGRSVKGHKVGLTSKAMRSMARATEPDFATLTDDFFTYEGATVSPAKMNDAKVEVEIAFVLGRDLPGPHVNVADVIRATEFVLPCLEIVDQRQKPGGPTPLVDTIADAASCGFVVLGANPRTLTQLDVRRVGAVLLKNGDQEVSGTGAAVMGNPVNSVAWLANKLLSFGTELKEGQVLLSGSFVRAIPFGPGDTLTALFGDGLGEVTLSVGRE